MAELIWDGKYSKDGKKQGPVRIALPFQTIETVNESVQERQKNIFAAGQQNSEWRNRLIWGDKKYVLPSLLPEFAGKVDLIYIDPPFDTGADFSFIATLPDLREELEFVKEPSILEQKAFRDTWGVSLEEKSRGLSSRDKYSKWFYETAVILRDLLKDDGSIYVHLDWHVGHYAKLILDEVFGSDNFLNEIIWWYYNKFQGNIKHFASNHDVILYYRKSDRFRFHTQAEIREKPIQQIKREWDKEKGSIVNAKDAEGKVLYQASTHRTVDDVWRISMLQPADKTQNLKYPTQKPEAILDRIVAASSDEGDLVLDCFSGAGTTAAVAEKLNRRWITCDLGRFAIHTTRKRLLGIPNVRPFEVQNLGKYERQAWQAAEFPAESSEERRKQEESYRNFILDLYKATPIQGKTWLHGVKGGRMVHVGAVDAPVTQADFKAIAQELWKSAGTGKDAPVSAKIDVLGWEFAFEMNETARDLAKAAKVDAHFKKIPKEVLESKAVEQGDIKFFELGSLQVDIKQKKREVEVALADFIIPSDDIPAEVRSAIKHWSQLVDYWAIDWDYKNDTFHNQWQSYRTRKDPKIELKHSHEYAEPGKYWIVVKVIDLLGNDTTKSVEVVVK